jgi:hypothetical protein
MVHSDSHAHGALQRFDQFLRDFVVLSDLFDLHRLRFIVKTAEPKAILTSRLVISC